MATRQAFATPDTEDDEFDPTLAMNTPLPAAPATPMDGGSGSDSSTGAQAQQFNTAPPPAPTPLSTAPTPASVFTPAPGFVNTSPTADTGENNPALATVSASNPASTAIDPFTGVAYTLQQLQAMNPDPNTPNGQALAALTGTSTGPQQPVPVDPNTFMAGLPDNGLGDTVDAGLTSLIDNNGMTPEQTSLLDSVNQIIASGGALPSDDTLEAQQLESARDNEAQAFNSQLGDARDQLASRGLVSEPGVPQGSEAEAIDNITQATAPAYAAAVQGVSTDQIQTQNARLTSAISTATGLDNDAAGNLVSSLGTGSTRQVQLAGIALDSLSQNTAWTEFLANYGLNRDQVLASIQNGNVGSLLTLLTLFEQTSNTSATGHI